MNKNIENYKKAVEQIHPSEELKNKTLENIYNKKQKKSSIYYLRYVTAFAAVFVVAIVGISFANKNKEDVLNNQPSNNLIKEEPEKIAQVEIRRFKNVEELKDVLKEKRGNGNYYRDDVVYESAVTEDVATKSYETYGATNSVDYSRTNNQVESVDEADILKTDGKYIYYSQNNKVYIVDKNLNLKATIKDDNFRPTQIFVNEKNLVVFGSKYNNKPYVVYNDYTNDDVIEEDVSTIYRPKTLVRVYDLANIENPKLKREISIDGGYQDARMIENNVYLVTQFYAYYNNIDEVKDIDILPSYEDSISKGVQYIRANDIAYFENTNNYGYSLIAGFNLDSNNEVNIETFFGSGTEMYVSENNMYIVTPNYSEDYWNANNTTIYKFRLENSKVFAVASAVVEGTVNNQFSIDEYKGNLRIATTSYKNSLRGIWDDDFDYRYSTHLTIFDDKLEKIGEIKDLIKDEEIYAVRFIGKIGYVVTFEQVDPLWVIDLSDPTNPVVKGKLEIPGYSSYLHPYDENHIIGIGYNVKSNGYGGVKNDTIKISMFDVSDVNNPKEIFNKTLDNNNAYSSIMYEHKALFFNKAENLIGFPINVSNKTGLLLYKIDMDNKEFIEIDDLLENRRISSNKINYIGSNSGRAIYIGDSIYMIYTNTIIRYDIKTFEKLDELELDN